MCGLILAPTKFKSDAVTRALDKMSYRGLSSKLLIKNGWWLGHTRLAIQDLSEEGDQPFDLPNFDSVAFVGEFFNHNGIGEQPYLIELLKSEDYEGFHGADGFWSVVHVKQSREVVAMTDHLSIKPLYWWPEHQIICSEIFPMFELAPAPELDEIYLSNCIKFGYDYSGRTGFKGIYQLPPGAALTLKGGKSNLRTYWNWDEVPRFYDLDRAITDSVSNRLISDRPVALLLSGGLDSSIIYYTLKSLGQKVACFSVENGESEFLPPGVRTLPVSEVSLSEAVSIMQAPLDLGSLLPQIQLARAVKEAGYHVCLTGDGADELFGGYSRAQEYDSQKSDVFCELPYYHLPRLDRVMMRETIELRSPFLAPTIVAMALSIPWGYRTQKQELKIAATGLVPEKIIQRNKHPLKSAAVLQNQLQHRVQLVQEFRNAVSSLRVQ
jgi:asparagine synthase (glutamine-hydrolysing)